MTTTSGKEKANTESTSPSLKPAISREGYGPICNKSPADGCYEKVEGENLQETTRFCESLPDERVFTKINVLPKKKRGDIKVSKYLLKNGVLVNNTSGEKKITSLRATVRSQCLSVVTLLAEHGADVNESDFLGRTPLNEALLLNLTDIAIFLIHRGAKVNRMDAKGRLPLFLAVGANNFELVQALALVDARIEKVDLEGNSAFTLAQRFNNTQMLDFFVRKSCEESVLDYNSNSSISNSTDDEFYVMKDIELSMAEEATEELLMGNNDRYVDDEEQGSSAQSNTNIVVEKEEDEEMSFSRAICEDNLEEIKKLLASGMNINDVGDDGFIPLSKAIVLGRTEIIKFLLTKKVNTCKAVKGRTPLIFAVQRDDLEIIKLLLQSGAEHTIQTALVEAINLENLEIVKLFLEKKVILNLVYKNGYTPLTTSIKTKNFQIVQAIVENGADVNMPDKNGNVPLALCFEERNTGIIKYLIEMGAKLPEELTKKYLQKYIEEDSLEMVRDFVELLNVNIILDCGSSPLIKATKLQNFEMVKFFLEYLNNIDGCDSDGKTALAIAASNQDFPLVKCLIECGADVNMAKEEIDKFENDNKDFSLYIQFLNKR